MLRVQSVVTDEGRHRSMRVDSEVVSTSCLLTINLAINFATFPLQGPVINAYPRQFVITDSDRDLPLEWPALRTQRYAVHHNPDLSVTRVKRDRTTLTLIGYAIDPYHPRLSDAQLLQQFLEECESPELLLRAAGQLAGRWALLAEFSDGDILLHDASGLRQVFYSDSSHTHHFCASQASTAAKFFTLQADSEATEGFLSTHFATHDPEYWWPGDSTPYLGVRCLLPNHYLDLRTRKAQRYAPLEPVKLISPRAAARVVAPLLTNLIDGISRRFELALPLTAGWDSRLILAACRSANVAPLTYTLRYASMSKTHQDIVLPPQIVQSFGWTHHILDCPTTASVEFAAAYKSYVDPAHNEACAFAEGLQKSYPRGRCSLSGHSNESVKCRLHPTPHRAPLTAKELAELNHMDATPFVLGKFEEWLQGARKAELRSGVSPLDLAHWELKVGRWAANGQAQWDVIHERFTLFSCRPVLLGLLGVDPRFRRPSNYLLLRELYKLLCPELLSFPFNPDQAPSVKEPRGVRALAHRAVELVRGH